MSHVAAFYFYLKEEFDVLGRVKYVSSYDKIMGQTISWRQRLNKVTASGQEIVRHIRPHKKKHNLTFYALFFLRLKQIKYKVSISELYIFSGAVCTDV